MTEVGPETRHAARRGAARGGALAAAALLLAPVLAAPSLVAAPSAHADAWRDAQFWLEDYGVTEAWETARGDGVTIAILDTGVDGDHPTLEGAVVEGTDVSGGGDGSGGPVDQFSTEHGTMVASLAAGRGQEATEDDLEELPEPEDYEDFSDEDWEEFWDDLIEELEEQENMGLTQGTGVLSPARLTSGEGREALDLTASAVLPASNSDDDDDDDDEDDEDDEEESAGVIGVAPEADVLSASMALEIPNAYGPDLEDQVVEAVDWAVANGADIINMSFGLPNQQEWPESWDEAFLNAAENDVLIVAAAGNRVSGSWSVGAPATIPGVLTVAGVNEEREISEDASAQGIAVDIAAPSEPLVGAVPDGHNTQWMGTSGAAPIVAGAAALVWSAHPELSAAEVKHRLLSTADGVGDGEGIDPEFGQGMLNVAEAVGSDDVPEFDSAAYETLEEWIRVHRRGESQESEHTDIPSDSGVSPGPEGDPRDQPQASEARVVQNWAGPVVVGVAALLVISVISVAAVHLTSRRRS
ncbi:S8 family peptidase [Nesterenkonia xinjiangensis]|uniref:Subtilisin family serine protease n=1 Tax=Nesterenkonia xinjiangensis TaxID=225327 RepID=A0A7Z0GJK3_9MICC|nr:S8 family serine peptidase [Nesterenkonia xinjiangensis]NYJ77112.1 subtilisin family serine protease [Nesterenkonia xinjiangensis]